VTCVAVGLKVYVTISVPGGNVAIETPTYTVFWWNGIGHCLAVNDVVVCFSVEPMRHHQTLLVHWWGS